MATVLEFDLIAHDLASKVFRNVGKKSGVLAKTFGGFGAAAATAFKGAGLAIAAVGTAAAKVGLETAANLERAQVSFTEFTGSAQTASDTIAALKKFTLETPFDLPGLLDTSKRLLGVGVNAKDLIPTIGALGDTAAAFGLSGEQFNRVTLAISQSLAKGRFAQEEFNQISEAGIPILKILSEALHKPVPELLKLSRQGDLLAADIFPKLLTQMQKDYGGAMSKQVDTLTGLWSNLMDAFRIGASDAIQPLIPLIKDGLRGATKLAFDGFEALKGLLDDLIPIFGAFISFLRTSVLPTLGKFGLSLVEKVVPVDDVDKKLKGLRTKIVDFFSGLTGAKIPGAEDLMNHIFEPSAAFKGGAAIRETLANGIGDAISKIDWKALGEKLGRGLVTAFDFVTSHIAEITQKIINALSGIDWVNVGKTVGGNAVGFAVGFLSGLGDNDLFTIDFWKKHFWDAVQAALFFAGAGKIAGVLEKVIAKVPILKVFAPLLKKIDQLTKPFQDAVVGFAKKVGKLGGTIVREFLNGVGEAFGKAGLGTRFIKWLQAIPTAVGVKLIDIREAGGRVVKGFSKGIKDAGKNVTRDIGRIVGLAIHPFAKAGTWLVKKGSALIAGLASGIATARDKIKTQLRKARDAITGFFKNAGNWLVGAGKRIVSGLISGLNSKLQAVRNKVADIARAVKNVWPNSPAAKEGPLKGVHFEDIGASIVGDLGKGLASGRAALLREVNAMASTLNADMSPQAFNVTPAAAPAPIYLTANFHGPVGSEQQLNNWLSTSLDNLHRQGRLRFGTK